MIKASILTRLVHSRAFGLGVAAIVAVAACVYFFGGYCVPLTGDNGLALCSANEWLPSPLLDFASGMAGCAATMLIMYLLNKVYNVLRSMSMLNLALFAAMQLATPDLFTQFYTGTVMAAVVPLCVMLLFSCFREPRSTRHVFLIFLLLSFFLATQYSFAVYTIVFFIGLGQMRIFNLRSVAAAFLGLVTPWWLLIGFGAVHPDEIALPEFVSIFSVINHEDTLLLLITLGVTAFAMLLCFVLNLLKTIAYNARARAYNGTFTVLALVTVAAACADYRNIIAYVPMLNFCAAMEITHYFSTHRAEKSFIPIFVLLAAYAAIFACQTVI